MHPFQRLQLANEIWQQQFSDSLSPAGQAILEELKKRSIPAKATDLAKAAHVVPETVRRELKKGSKLRRLGCEHVSGGYQLKA